MGTASGTGAATQAQLPQAQLPQAQLPQAQLPQAQLERARLARRGRWLTAATLGYNSLEGVIAVGAGLAAGSVALVGFGADSAIEVSAALVALWRLRAERVADPTRRARAERTALRLVGVSFLLLAAYIAVDAASALRRREVPELTRVGLLLTACSIVVMPLLARAKRRVAGALASGALAAEATQTQLCAYLSAIVLGGLALNALFGWWWADPVAALAMVPIIAREGLDGVRGRGCCPSCASVGAASVSAPSAGIG